MPFDPTTRPFRITSPLGPNVLGLTSLAGAEGISEPFSFDLEVTSTRSDIAASELINKSVGVEFDLENNKTRYIHGRVCSWEAGDVDGSHRIYRLRIVPWLWFLRYATDCRVFQGLTVRQIVEQVFAEYQFTDYRWDLESDANKHPARTYCVQYRETSLAFISRLLEDEGIFYYFEHKKDKHVLVLADRTTAYIDCLESQVTFPTVTAATTVNYKLSSWKRKHQFHASSWSHTDYNFLTPSTSLLTTSPTTHTVLNGITDFKHFDYPGGHQDVLVGKERSDFRMGEVEIGFEIAEGTSNYASFTAGGKFKVASHRIAKEVGAVLVLTRVGHTARQLAAYATVPTGNEGYTNEFTGIPASVVFRPPRRTPKPVVQGPHTAVVVGPADEVVYTDAYGRAKIQFHWDRVGQKNENSSCWVRVSQAWAGSGYGSVLLPHIGQEVIVSWLRSAGRLDLETFRSLRSFLAAGT